MAEFGSTATQASEVQAFTTPKEGIVEQPVAIEAASNLFKAVGGALIGQKESRNQAFLADFMNRQMNFIEAADQGSLDRGFARTNLRANFMQAVTDYPGLRDDLVKIQQDILGTAGMGSFITEETAAEEREEKLRDKMVQEGYVSVNATEQEEKQAMNEYMVAQDAARRYEEATRTIQLERDVIGLTKAQQEQLDARESKAASDYLTDSAPAAMTKLLTDFAAIQTEVEGNPNVNLAQGLQQLDQLWTNFQAQNAPHIAKVTSHQAQALQKVFQEQYDIARKSLTGKYTVEEAQHLTANNNAAINILALQDPTISAAIALSDLGIPIAPNTSVNLMTATSRLITENEVGKNPASMTASSPEEAKALEAYLDILTKQGGDEQQEAAAADHLQKVFNGVEGDVSRIIDDPTEIRPFVDWLSTQAFYDLYKSDPDIDLTGASQVLQNHYFDEVMKMIRNE